MSMTHRLFSFFFFFFSFSDFRFSCVCLHNSRQHASKWLAAERQLNGEHVSQVPASSAAKIAVWSALSGIAPLGRTWTGHFSIISEIAHRWSRQQLQFEVWRWLCGWGGDSYILRMDVVTVPPHGQWKQKWQHYFCGLRFSWLAHWTRARHCASAVRKYWNIRHSADESDLAKATGLTRSVSSFLPINTVGMLTAYGKFHL